MEERRHALEGPNSEVLAACLDALEVLNGHTGNLGELLLRQPARRTELRHPTPEVVENVVRPRRRHRRWVYEAGLKKNPNLAVWVMEGLGEATARRATGGTGQADPMSTKSSPPRRPRVLVIDDDASLGRGISRLLRRVAEVTVEVDPRAALRRLLRGEVFDLVLCDVMMPILDGAEVVEHVVASAPHLASRFVFMSGGMPDQVGERIVASGRTCLEKPLSTEVLMKLMARIQVSWT